MTLQDLHDLYYKDCRRFARSMARDRAEADDTVQEVFMRAQGHLPLLEILDATERRSWLFTAIRNRLIDERRAEKREERALADLEDPAPFPMESSAEVQRRLEELPELQRDILHRRYWLGMNSRQIGEEMQLPPSTVRWHMQQAHETLKKKLSRQW